jgi:protein-tyrosine phosphatase
MKLQFTILAHLFSMYGTKEPQVRHCCPWLLFSTFVFLQIMRILMVCLGNICRSPIAEGIMRAKIEEHGLGWTVSSAGTESMHVGEPPHRYSQKVCQVNGIDISLQRAKKITSTDLENYDKIYAMANDVFNDIVRLADNSRHLKKVDYFLNELKPNSYDSVPDPWYGDEDGFLPVYQLIEETCEAIIKKYK